MTNGEFIQIRLTKQQKEQIRVMAQNDGFSEKGLSQYCRNKLLIPDTSLKLIKEIHLEVIKK